jgi:hypothetical protein
MIYDFSSNLIDHFLCQPSFIQYVKKADDFTADFGAKVVIYSPSEYKTLIVNDLYSLGE